MAGFLCFFGARERSRCQVLGVHNRLSRRIAKLETELTLVRHFRLSRRITKLETELTLVRIQLRIEQSRRRHWW